MLAAAEMSLLFFCRIEHEAGGRSESETRGRMSARGERTAKA